MIPGSIRYNLHFSNVRVEISVNYIPATILYSDNFAVEKEPKNNKYNSYESKDNYSACCAGN